MLCVLEIIIPIVEHIKQDAWIRENPSEPPVAVLMFTFTSKGGFFANNPIHVRIQMWLTVGKNYSNIVICFPDAYAYPRNQTPGKPPNAGWIPITKSGNLTGEGDIEFTSSGSFGYIIYSEEKLYTTLQSSKSYTFRHMKTSPKSDLPLMALEGH